MNNSFVFNLSIYLRNRKTTNRAFLQVIKRPKVNMLIKGFFD